MFKEDDQTIADMAHAGLSLEDSESLLRPGRTRGIVFTPGRMLALAEKLKIR
jgi:hypothetical protein